MASVERVAKQPSAREQHWRDMIQRWQLSGQTVRAFCAQHRLSKPSFYSWRRTIQLRDQPPHTDAIGPRAIASDEPDEAAERPAFVPVRVLTSAVDATPPAAAGLELVVGARRTVRVPAGFDADTLRRLLTVLEETPSC
jgi:hypothetical protein